GGELAPEGERALLPILRRGRESDGRRLPKGSASGGSGRPRRPQGGGSATPEDPIHADGDVQDADTVAAHSSRSLLRLADEEDAETPQAVERAIRRRSMSGLIYPAGRSHLDQRSADDPIDRHYPGPKPSEERDRKRRVDFDGDGFARPRDL